MDAAAAIVARQPRVREALIARQRELGAAGGRRDGRARHRDGRVPGRGREDLPRRVAGGARAPARDRSRRTPRAAARRPSRTWRPRSPSATASIAPARPRRWSQAGDAVVIDTTGLSIGDAVERVLEVVERAGVGVRSQDCQRVTEIENYTLSPVYLCSCLQFRSCPCSRPRTRGRAPSASDRAPRSCPTPSAPRCPRYCDAERLADVVHAILIGRRVVAARRFVAHRVRVFPARVDVAGR